MNIKYFALGNEDTASSRLRVYKIAVALNQMGHSVRVTTDEVRGTPSEHLIVVQKRLDLRRHMKEWLKRGMRVIFDIDDPLDTEVPPCSLLTVGSKFLAKQYKNSIYVPDCLDVDNVNLFKRIHSDKLQKVCWFGNECNLYHAEPVRMACKELGMQLVVVTDLNTKEGLLEWDGVCYQQWDRATVDRRIIDCDLVVCPYVDGGRWGEEWVNAKGENRLLKAWALGLPVVGTPIPSYMEFKIKHTAQTPGEWVSALEVLQKKHLRERDAKRGREIALQSTAHHIAVKWLKAFGNV